MNTLFNPENAIPVEEGDEMDALMEIVEKRVKTLRSQIIADIFKEFTTTAKDERKALLATASKDFASMVEESVKRVMTEGIAQGQQNTNERLDDLVTRQKSLCACTERIEEGIRAVEMQTKNAAESAKDGAMSADAPASPAMPQIAPVDEGRLVAAIVAALPQKQEAMAEAVTPVTRSWNFTVKRDDYSRIKSVTANPI